MNTIAKQLINNKINDLISDIYYQFNSACIIDYDNLTIVTPEQTLHFNSIELLNLFILQEIKEGTLTI